MGAVALGVMHSERVEMGAGDWGWQRVKVIFPIFVGGCVEAVSEVWRE
jgi:hypothetical protein